MLAFAGDRVCWTQENSIPESRKEYSADLIFMLRMGKI